MLEDFPRRVAKAAEAVACRADAKPRIGVILGSGLSAFADTVRGTEIPFADIPGMPVPAVKGHKAFLKVGEGCAVLGGRIHFYEGHAMDDVVLPVFLLCALGVRTLIVTNAAGGIHRAFRPGDLVLIRDQINLMGANPLRGPDTGLGPRFPDMTSAYSAALRETARRASPGPVAEGVYAALAGPCYETPAEIRMLAALGADMVGMSTVPEVIAARFLGMEVLGVSCITNMAAGILDAPLDHAEVVARGKDAAPRFAALLGGTIRLLGGAVDAG
jgi:purine-nucleoside phosphorylase